ncbi:hypothetical protein J7J83_03515, partial [bacterium]|nr:hypothetical protein [bacterium]
MRHRKNFNKLGSIGSTLVSFIKKPLTVKRSVGSYKPVSQVHILKRALGFMAFFVIITSFTPNIAFSDANFAVAQMDYPQISSNIIADDSGFLIPINPQTGQADRSEMTDKITHIVKSGETLSLIA